MRQKLGWRTRAVQSIDKKPKQVFCDTFTDNIFTGEFSVKTERYPHQSFRKVGEQHHSQNRWAGQKLNEHVFKVTLFPNPW